MIDIEVNIAPFPKARPRVTRRGTYMPANYQKARQALREAFRGIVIPDGCLSVTVWAYRRIPKNKREAARILLYDQPCDVGADSDNIVAGVLDSLFENDKRVTSACCRKRWSDRDYMRIVIKEDNNGLFYNPDRSFPVRLYRLVNYRKRFL